MRYSLLLFSAALLAQSDPAERKCSVEGVVTQESGGQGLRQVEVGLVPLRERKPGQPAPAAIGVYTDSNGRFRIPELEPGVYRVRLRKEGYSPSQPSGSIVLPRLEPGRELRDLRFSMAPQSVLSGRVLDDHGDPVANASLVLLRARTIRGRRSLVAGGGFAASDERGAFRMAGIDPGRYLLSAEDVESRDVVFPSGGAATAYVTTYFPGVSDEMQAQVIEIGRGTLETGIEVRLRREPVYPVRGRALSSDGQPLARFLVSAVPARGGAAMLMGSLSNRFSNGEFSLPGLRAGAWILTASADGSPTRSSAEIEVRGGAVEGIVLRPAVTQQISGAAVLDDAAGGPPDWTRVGVAISTADGRYRTAPATPDPGGSFTLSFAGAGRAWLELTGNPASGTYLARVELGTQDVSGQEFEIPPGAMPPLRLVFRRGAATLTGRTNTTDPSALAAYPAISLWPADPARRDARAAATGGLAPDGTFTIGDIAPGEYLVQAGAGSEAGPPDDLEARSTRVKLEPGATVAIQLALPRQEGAR